MSLPLPPALNTVNTWVFDLDNTLYDAAIDLFCQIDVRMGLFIQNLLSLSPDQARALQKRYFQDHGTTLRGLMDNHAIDPQTYLDFVHDIDYSPLSAAPALDAALERLSGRKIIFTNADTAHAARVLDRLGIARHFDVLFDIEAAGYCPKPAPAIYETLLTAGAIDPARAAMVEDMARNLEPAAALGMATVWVKTGTRWGRSGGDAAYVHHATDDLVGWLNGVADGDF